MRTIVERALMVGVMAVAIAAGVGMSVLLGGYVAGFTALAGVSWVLAGAMKLALWRFGRGRRSPGHAPADGRA